MNIQNGKYVMPAFQRQFVWSMEQIEKLWDSILLDYPIATFLFWHVDDNNVTWDTYVNLAGILVAPPPSPMCRSHRQLIV